MRALTLLSIALTATLSAACVGELTPIDDTTGGSTTPPPPSTTGGDGDGGITPDASDRALFDESIAPMMALARPKGSCASCHDTTAATPFPPFFLGAGPAEWYDSIIGSTVIGATPQASSLVTHGDHTGDAFCSGPGTPYAACTQDEITLIGQWIEALNTPGQ